MANSAVQFLRLPVVASSGLAVVASGLLYFKQKYVTFDPGEGGRGRGKRERERELISS